MRQRPSRPDPSAARQRLNAILREMGALFAVLFRREPMFAACVYHALRRCGNAGCHCAQGERHPAWVMSFREGDRMVNRSVPEDEREALIARSEEYRSFRGACRQWRKLSKEAESLFAVLRQAREVTRHQKGGDVRGRK